MTAASKYKMLDELLYVVPTTGGLAITAPLEFVS